MTTKTETITLHAEGEAYDITMEVQNPCIGPRLEACIQIKATIFGDYKIIAWFYPTNPPHNTDFSFDMSITYRHGGRDVSFNDWTIGNIWQLFTVGPIKLLENALDCITYEDKSAYECNEKYGEGMTWSSLTSEQQEFIQSIARDDLSMVVRDLEEQR